MKKLEISSVKDLVLRKNFQNVSDALRKSDILKGQWEFHEITVTAAVTNQSYAHNLGFAPKDIITTSVSAGAALTWDYDSFDDTIIQFDTDGACTFRFFVGRYEETEV